jgi:hypothetical protein
MVPGCQGKSAIVRSSDGFAHDCARTRTPSPSHPSTLELCLCTLHPSTLALLHLVTVAPWYAKVDRLWLALVVAAVAWTSARRAARRLDALNQSYWELRYDYTRLRAQVARLDPEQLEPPDDAPPAAAPSVSFVPLSSIRKKSDG